MARMEVLRWIWQVRMKKQLVQAMIGGFDQSMSSLTRGWYALSIAAVNRSRKSESNSFCSESALSSLLSLSLDRRELPDDESSDQESIEMSSSVEESSDESSLLITVRQNCTVCLAISVTLLRSRYVFQWRRDMVAQRLGAVAVFGRVRQNWQGGIRFLISNVGGDTHRT
jgi:hypothetical protein